MTASAKVAYRFGGFRVDAMRRLLFGADGAPIRLKPKVFDTLLYLVERPGELVAKEALLEAVWPHVVVEENNLNKAISTLRQVFGETRDEHRFIVTEPGRGYRFVASVEAVPAGTTEPPPARAVASVQADATAASVPASQQHVASGPHVVESKRPLPVLASAGWRRRPAVMIALSIVTLFAVAAVWSWQRATGAREARIQGIPEIARLVEQGNYPAAFERAQGVVSYVRDDPLLQTLTPLFTVTYSVTTTPPDADVLVRVYDAVDDEWQRLGRTPLADIPLPRGALRWRIEKRGFDTAEFATTAHDRMRSNAIQATLHAVGTQPAEMVWVPGAGALAPNGVPLRSVELAPFFIDRYEVTNKAYQEFVDAGAYERRSYWEGLDFSKDGQSLSWEEAMRLFVDATGRPGPAGWELGDYPEGQDEYPVTGISWYEATAYARYRGKSLPTVYHWTTAALDAADLLAASITSQSNFGTTGPAPVGSHQGLGPHGTYDMFGNVREWLLNPGPSGGWVIGGGWEDIAYQYVTAVPTSLFERSPLNGVRLVQDTGDTAAVLREPVDLRPILDETSIRPVSDEIFAAYASQFEYRRGDLNATQPSSMATTDNWIKQRVTIDAGYGAERMDVILFIPTRFEPPFQVVIYHPGAEAFGARATIDSLEASGATIPLDFIVKSGRVFVYPVYQGTFSRWSAAWNSRDDVRNVREWIERRSDLGRTIDYLETRPDMDTSRIAYFGSSLGASFALPLIALEPRLKVAVLLSGGFIAGPMPPSINPINYASRITIPVLMVNGRFDYFFPVETAQLPLFNQLGTAAQHKRHVILETGHGTLPRSGILNETLGWLDNYLGTPVRSTSR
jgi:formylglycine-generating enzyme required for sulfatase activity/DNA-binding winged helix-turn-helix (wHTH) protein